MRCRAIVAMLLVAALAATIAVPTASARAKKIPTRIEVLGEQDVFPGLFLTGLLHSKSKKCVRNRSVELGLDLDRDLTSRNGAWALYVPAVDGGVSAIEVSVRRKKLRNGDLCEHKTILWNPPLPG